MELRSISARDSRLSLSSHRWDVTRSLGSHYRIERETGRAYGAWSYLDCDGFLLLFLRSLIDKKTPQRVRARCDSMRLCHAQDKRSSDRQATKSLPTVPEFPVLFISQIRFESAGTVKEHMAVRYRGHRRAALFTVSLLVVVHACEPVANHHDEQQAPSDDAGNDAVEIPG